LFSLTLASTPTTPAALCSHIPLPFYIPSSTFLPNSFTERTCFFASVLLIFTKKQAKQKF
jgi:hypothetical protein